MAAAYGDVQAKCRCTGLCRKVDCGTNWAPYGELRPEFCLGIVKKRGVGAWAGFCSNCICKECWECPCQCQGPHIEPPLVAPVVQPPAIAGAAAAVARPPAPPIPAQVVAAPSPPPPKAPAATAPATTGRQNAALAGQDQQLVPAAPADAVAAPAAPATTGRQNEALAGQVQQLADRLRELERQLCEAERRIQALEEIKHC